MAKKKNTKSIEIKSVKDFDVNFGKRKVSEKPKGNKYYQLGVLVAESATNLYMDDNRPNKNLNM